MQAARETLKLKLSPICDSKSQIVVQAKGQLRVIGGLVTSSASKFRRVLSEVVRACSEPVRLS
jgi:hypothetical protein